MNRGRNYGDDPSVLLMTMREWLGRKSEPPEIRKRA